MTELSKRPLGRTGMEISTVGLGTWALGGGGWKYAWGPQDDKESVAAIHRAVEVGINWIDTAPAYGVGHSEEVVAEALAGIPEADRPYVFTKCGEVPNPGGPMEENILSGTRASILSELEDSLRRLQVERIDLYQMHWPPEDAAIDEYWQTFVDLRAAGKVGALGLCNHSVGQLEEAEQIAHVDSLQSPFSMVRRDLASEVIPWCLGNGTGVIVYGPLQAGLLSGAFSVERARALGQDDWRSRSGEFRSPKLEANLALVDVLRPIAADRGVSVGAVAIAWTLAFDGLTGAIVGGRSPAQVDDWVAASNLQLSQDELSTIEAGIKETGAGSGPTFPA